MGKIKKSNILKILDKYDKDNITIATLGSHTSLHILKGAKEEGFKTAIICEKGRETPYQRFNVADEYIIVNEFKDIVNEEIQQQLRDINAIVIPHGSFVAYAGLKNIEDKFNVPIFGNRDVLRWESEREKERQLLVEGNIRIPYKYNSPEDIDRPVMVKFPGARGGRGYFVASSPTEFKNKIHIMKERGWLEDSDIDKAHIEEYVSGCNYCIHYFYSALEDKVEIMGMDTRYESSIDGFVRMPAKDQLDINLTPSYVVTGNHPAVIRESLLPQVFEIGDKLVESAKKLVSPGLNGPFCMQTLVNDNLEVICFEISARTDGGTNTFMNGSPYSYLTHGKPMSMGRRISLEIKNAIEKKELEKIIT